MLICLSGMNTFNWPDEASEACLAATVSSPGSCITMLRQPGLSFTVCPVLFLFLVNEFISHLNSISELIRVFVIAIYILIKTLHSFESVCMCVLVTVNFINKLTAQVTRMRGPTGPEILVYLYLSNHLLHLWRQKINFSNRR